MVTHLLFFINNTVTYTIDLYNKACRAYIIQEWLTGGWGLKYLYREREIRDENRGLKREMIIY